MNLDGLTSAEGEGPTGGSGTGPVGGGGTGPGRAVLSLSEPHPGGLIRATLAGRQVGYALPLDGRRYLVRLPNSCAAPFDSRHEALAALRGLATSPT